MNDRQRNMIQLLLREYGLSFAEEAGVILKNEPIPLFQVLVLSLLLNAPIDSSVAVHAARALRLEGLSTPESMAEASWQRRVDVLARHGYGRYGDRASSWLGRLGERVLLTYQGDLRQLEQEAAGDSSRAWDLLQQFDGLGPAGASLFLSEVYEIWRALEPLIDQKVMITSAELGLAQSKLELSHLVAPDQYPKLISALVRVGRDDSSGEILRHATI